MSWELIAIFSTIILGWIGFIEKRLSMLKTDFEQRIESEKELSQVTAEFFKEELARMNAKLDAQSQLLLQIQIQNMKNKKD